MKRLTVMILMAGLVGFGDLALSADPLPLPPPTAMVAPTAPLIPVPVIRDGQVLPSGENIDAKIREILGSGPMIFPPVIDEHPATGPRTFGQLGWFTRMTVWWKKPPACTLTGSPKRWCEDCAPAVRHPLPPLPAGVINTSYVTTTAAPNPICQAGGQTPPVPVPVPVGGGCATGNCSNGGGKHGHAESCWSRFKGWLCFHPTPAKFPLVPTPRFTPFYTYFPCHERPGIDPASCATGSCATMGTATMPGTSASGTAPSAPPPRPSTLPPTVSSTAPVAGPTTQVATGSAAGRLGLLPFTFPRRGVNGPCQSCPQSGSPAMPGYRLAIPEPTTTTAGSIVPVPTPDTVPVIVR